MLVHVPEVLTPGELDAVNAGLREDGGDFGSGRSSAGQQAAQVKRNEEFQAPQAVRDKLERCVAEAVRRHPLVQRAALPLRISHPIFARYRKGMSYGWHVDEPVEAVRGGYRTDLAMTVFLNDPSAYEGGALVVRTPYGEQAARHAAGDGVLYPADRIHRVEAVAAGERRVAVLWIQSQVRDAQQREILLALDALRMPGAAGDLPDDRKLQLDWLHARLMRMWADV